MAYSVEIKSSAGREIRALERGIQIRILRKIEALKQDPRPPGVKKLHGNDELYRVRVGNFRIIYQIQDQRLIITVVRVGNRRDIYD